MTAWLAGWPKGIEVGVWEEKSSLISSGSQNAGSIASFKGGFAEEFPLELG